MGEGAKTFQIDNEKALVQQASAISNALVPTVVITTTHLLLQSARVTAAALGIPLGQHSGGYATSGTICLFV
jgi:hypothetical protein